MAPSTFVTQRFTVEDALHLSTRMAADEGFEVYPDRGSLGVVASMSDEQPRSVTLKKLTPSERGNLTAAAKQHFGSGAPDWAVAMGVKAAKVMNDTFKLRHMHV